MVKKELIVFISVRLEKFIVFMKLVVFLCCYFSSFFLEMSRLINLTQF